MAKLFDAHPRLVPAWLAAARHLQSIRGPGRNLVLEIASPGVLTLGDLSVIRAVDAALAASGENLTMETVANTIFPQGLYALRGRPAIYTAYSRAISRAKKRGTWGTYFERMTQRTRKDGTKTNPLETLVEKLARAARSNRLYSSTYELSPSDPVRDLERCAAEGAELAIYEPGIDQNRPYGGPCLSHLSFKIRNRTALDLTAVYRSHHYCMRALGNLIGLARLQGFVAAESGLQMGSLTCISTHAELDFSSWGGAPAGRQLLESFPPT